MEKKNIAIIVRALNHGGAERCASNMSIDLSKHYNVHMIVFDGRDMTYPYGGTLHNLNILPTDSKIKKILNIWKRCKAVSRIKKENNIDCAISLLGGANLVNVLSKNKEKTIVSIRDFTSASVKTKGQIFELEKYCKMADCVVALSKTVAEDLIDKYNVDKTKVKVVYNSVDADRLMKLAEDGKTAKPDYPYIVTMGRLIPVKGHSHLLRAFKKVVEAHPEYKLVILGQGDDEKNLRHLCKKLGISENVVFMGYIKNPHSIIAQSRFFVFSSINEGLGNVILESLACGKTVVSTDCLAGPREILAPDSNLKKTEIGISEPEFAQYGVLVPKFPNCPPDFERIQLSNEEEILGNVMVDLINDEDKLHHYENLASIRIKDFTMDKINSDWIKVIESN